MASRKPSAYSAPSSSMALVFCLLARKALSKTRGMGKRSLQASWVAAISPSVAAGSSVMASTKPR